MTAIQLTAAQATVRRCPTQPNADGGPSLAGKQPQLQRAD